MLKLAKPDTAGRTSEPCAARRDRLDQVARSARPPLISRPADEARATAAAFAREFARLGHSPPNLMRLFADPFYAPAHAALQELGEVAVREIVAVAVRDRPPLPRPAGSLTRPLRQPRAPAG